MYSKIPIITFSSMNLLDQFYERKNSRSNLIQRRADICIMDVRVQKAILIDCTIACPVALKYKGSYDKSGDAANKSVLSKIKNYESEFNIKDDSKAIIYFFAAECPGSLSNEAIQFCQLLATLSNKDYDLILQELYQRVSVCMQYIRSKQILHCLNLPNIISPTHVMSTVNKHF